MRLTIPTADLVTALSRVAAAAAQKSPIAALQHCLLRADDVVTLRAGDTDLQIVTTTGAATEVPGAVCVMPRDLLAVARGIRSEHVTLASDEGKLTVTAGKSRATLPILPASEYITPPEMGTDGQTVAGFARAIDVVLEAISTDEGRPNLCGAHLAGGWLTATDGHRLHRAPVAYSGPEVIIPRRALADLRRILAPGASVQICATDRGITLTTGDSQIWSRVMDAAFPNVERVIPSRAGEPVEISRKLLADRTKHVANLAPGKSRLVRMAFAGGALRLIATDADRGECADEVDITGTAEVTVGVNADYLLDVLAATEAESLSLWLPDSALGPLLFGDSEALWVVMPLRV